MLLNKRDVSAAIPGFHPVLTFRLWLYGRKTLRKLQSGELTEAKLIEQLRASGVKVTVTER